MRNDFQWPGVPSVHAVRGVGWFVNDLRVANPDGLGGGGQGREELIG